MQQISKVRQLCDSIDNLNNEISKAVYMGRNILEELEEFDRTDIDASAEHLFFCRLHDYLTAAQILTDILYEVDMQGAESAKLVNDLFEQLKTVPDQA